LLTTQIARWVVGDEVLNVSVIESPKRVRPSFTRRSGEMAP
jgi:hypothetical protein